MSKKINFATVNADARKALSHFFYAVYRSAELSNEKREKAQSHDAKIADAKSAMEKNPCADTVTAYNAALHAKTADEKSIAERIKGLNPFKDEGLALIPECLYKDYCALMEKETKTTRDAFNADIKTALEDMGITITTETQLTNTVGWLRSHTSGVVKSGSKTVLHSGKLTSTKSKSQFNELFVRVLIDLFVDKKVCEFGTDEENKYALVFFEYDEDGQLVK